MGQKMKKPVGAVFHAYRYQILPICQKIQMDLAGKIRSLEDLKRHKNEFFASALSSITTFHYNRAPLVHCLVYDADDLTIIRVAVERDLVRQRKDFTTEPVENWPDTWVAFDNRPDVQKCLIQSRGGGFQDTQTVVRILEGNLNDKLRHDQLAAAFEPIYERNVFWNLVKHYEGKITQIEFELISPNMSNISSSLTLDLAGLNRTTNTQRTKLQLNSDPGSSLTPDTSDPMVVGLVDYASQGGGDITLRARGVKKKMHTAKGITEIVVDEIELHGKDPAEVAKLFRNVLGK
jgi:hypothetical protein